HVKQVCGSLGGATRKDRCELIEHLKPHALDSTVLNLKMSWDLDEPKEISRNKLVQERPLLVDCQFVSSGPEDDCQQQWHNSGRHAVRWSLSYSVPTGETNTAGLWDGPTLNWTVTLTGGTFKGRTVNEADGGNHVDTCHYDGSPFSSYAGIQGTA